MNMLELNQFAQEGILPENVAMTLENSSRTM